MQKDQSFTAKKWKLKSSMFVESLVLIFPYFEKQKHMFLNLTE